ncbi:AbrB/MazE/SpoVT family DNA-binding domain-containing protein [archaeon]|jgi:antitoxin component of MazEF toxin-antitoxin module|nr:AbrB/MazE/SpoVT family DNA-binding domain-containing protein [archaeon]MBT6761674.1 AbrB/MazE/SpoVT family DNA-binding domain-containing protein [archaeon]
MQRKLVKQGRGALTVTLPSKWLKERKLTAGQVIEVTEGNDRLVIQSSKQRTTKKTSLDLRHCKRRSMFFHILLGKYMDGYDVIEIVHRSPELMNQIVPHMMGFAISKHSSTKTIFRNIVAVPEDNFEVILRRAGHQLVKQAEDIQLVVSNQITEKEYQSQERILDQHILYCMRYLNKYQSNEASYRQFLLLATFESVGDQLRYIAKNIKKNRKVAKAISDLVQKYVDLIFAKDFDNLYLLLKPAIKKYPKRTYLDGLVYSLMEMLYNNIGYLVEERK